MLDPGRYIAQAIYFLLWSVAQGFWEANRSLLSIAVIVESINTWITDNIGYFVEAIVNALEAPMSALFVIAIGALGAWYAFNTIVATNKWVDPSKLVTYGFITLFFFSSPILVIDAMEDIRVSLSAGMQASVLSGASGDIFDTGMSSGTDETIPPAIPDVNADGVIGSFDLVAYLMGVDNVNQLNNIEFPPDFEATYFPYGDPATIDLSDESDRTEALRLAWDGIKRLFYALMAIPTAIAEHFLRLSLTGAAMILYAGVPFALMLSFFIYTQAFLGAYIRQFINLLVETFLSVIIVGLMVGLMIAAAEISIGLYIGASIIALIVILWRIKGAFKLATAAFDLFGGGSITGGAAGADLRNMATQTAGAAVGLGAAALTGGSALALAGGLSAMSQQQGTTNDPAMQNRIKQLKTVAGYAAGKSRIMRRGIESAHEVRTFGRNFYDGGLGDRTPTTLDYLRLGSQMSSMNSSPWMAMGLSPSLRQAYDEIGGRGSRYGRYEAYDEDGANVARELGLNDDDDGPETTRPSGGGPDGHGPNGSSSPPSHATGSRQGRGKDGEQAEGDGNEETRQLGNQIRSLEGAITDLTRAIVGNPDSLRGREGANGSSLTDTEVETGDDMDDGRKRQPTQQQGLLDELDNDQDTTAKGSTAVEDQPEAVEPQRVVIAGEDRDGDGEMDAAAGMQPAKVIADDSEESLDDQPHSETQRVIVTGVDSDGDGETDTISMGDALSSKDEATAGDTTADTSEQIRPPAAEPAESDISPSDRPSPMITEPGSQPPTVITETDDQPQIGVTEPGVDEQGRPIHIDTEFLAGAVAGAAASSMDIPADQPQRIEIENEEGAPIRAEIDTDAITNAIAGTVSSTPPGQPLDIDTITQAIAGALEDAAPGIPLDTDAIAAAVAGAVDDTPSDQVDGGNLAVEIANAVAIALSSTPGGQTTVNVTAVAGEGTQTIIAGDNDGGTPAVPQTTFAPSAPPNQGVVVITSGSSGRQVEEVMVNLVGAMDNPNRAVVRQAHAGIQEYAGPQAAATIQQAVTQHGTANVQQSINVTAELVDTFAAQGATGDQILSQFQSGGVAEIVRQQANTALTDEQIAAVADAVLMPRRVLSKADLADAIAETLQQGYTSEDALAAQIGTPTNFGGDTGAIRTVMQGAQEMQIGQKEMRRMTEQISQGLKQEVRQQLQQLGHSRLTVDEFVNGLETLPDTLQVPQTAAFRPGDVEGYKLYTKNDVQ